MVVAEWVVWLVMANCVFFLLWWEATSISAWRASWLDNTTGDLSLGCIICMNDDRTSNNRSGSIELHQIVPVVVACKSTVTSSD
jgi:hypothetical protein